MVFVQSFTLYILQQLFLIAHTQFIYRFLTLLFLLFFNVLNANLEIMTTHFFREWKGPLHKSFLLLDYFSNVMKDI